MKRIVILFSVFLLSSSLLAQGWDSQDPLPQGNRIFSVFFTDASTGWAVGSSGIIVHTTDGGTSWTTQNSGTTQWLSSVFFIDASTGWAVGESGTEPLAAIVHTTDGGTSWTAQNSGTDQWLYSVFFTDANTGLAVGQGATVVQTTDGGTSWTAQTTGGNFLSSVFFTDASTGWAVGYLTPYGAIRHTTDGGTSWTYQPSPTTNSLYSVCFTDGSTGWAVGAGGTIVHTTDGGTSWTAQTSGTENDLRSVYFTDANTGWAVGLEGAIVYTTNGGTIWTAQTSGTTNHLYSVFFTDASTGWAVGDGGTIVHTTTGGTGIEPPPSPTLNSPPDDATVSTSPLLSWNPSEGALWYTLQVSRSPYFITYTLNRTNITETSYQLAGLQADTTFYWRVSVFDGTGTSRYSETWSFGTSSVPNQVSLLFPEEGALVTADSVVLVWRQGPSAIDRYWLEEDTDSLFSTPFIDSLLTDTAYTLSPLLNGQTHWWKVKAHNVSGWGPFSEVRSFTVLLAGVEDERVPTVYSLSQNHPNPFNPSTTIDYTLARSVQVRLEVFNVLGEKVRVLRDGAQDAGYHSVVFDAEGLPSGIYFYRLQARPLVNAPSGGRAGDFVETRKLVLMR